MDGFSLCIGDVEGLIALNREIWYNLIGKSLLDIGFVLYYCIIVSFVCYKLELEYLSVHNTWNYLYSFCISLSWSISSLILTTFYQESKEMEIQSGAFALSPLHIFSFHHLFGKLFLLSFFFLVSSFRPATTTGFTLCEDYFCCSTYVLPSEQFYSLGVACHTLRLLLSCSRLVIWALLLSDNRHVLWASLLLVVGCPLSIFVCRQ